MAAPLQGPALGNVDVPYIQSMWGALSIQVTAENNIIAITAPIFASFDQNACTFLLQAYSGQVGENGMFVRDSVINRVFLGPAAHFNRLNLVAVAGQIPILLGGLRIPNLAPAGQGSGAHGRSVFNKSGKIPRPPNAFILYRKDNHSMVVGENPGLHNNQISVIIGAMWNTETADVRELYKALAENLKQEHLRKYPGYQYQPRKSSEKKRRMTKKKAAALAANPPPPPTPSFVAASGYPEIAQEGGELFGMFNETRMATLPLSANAELGIEIENWATNPPSRGLAPEGLGENLTPSAEFVRAQQNDLDLLTLTGADIDDPLLSSFLKEMEDETGDYPAFHDLNYEMSEYNISSGWRD